MGSYVLLILLCVASFGSQFFAQGRVSTTQIDRPDFSGKWSIDLSKSRFSVKDGVFSREEIFDIEIRQRLSLVTFSVRSKVDRGTLEYWKYEVSTDGRPTKLPDARDPDDYMIGAWDGDKLIVRIYESTKRLVAEWHHELLADGNSLQITFKLSDRIGANSQNSLTERIDEQLTEYLVFNRVKEK